MAIMGLQESSLMVFLILVVAGIAVSTDLAWRRIPNVLTGPAILVGIASNTFFAGWNGLLWSITGLAIGSALLFLPVAVGWWGAGDLKLFAALGTIGGPIFILWVGLYSFAAGGLMALAVLLMKRQTAPVLAGIAVDLYTKQAPQATSGIRLPYAVPIAVGTLIALMVR